MVISGMYFGYSVSPQSGISETVSLRPDYFNNDVTYDVDDAPGVPKTMFSSYGTASEALNAFAHGPFIPSQPRGVP